MWLIKAESQRQALIITFMHLFVILFFNLLQKTQYLAILDEFKKFAILKKGIGIESQNLCKQFNDQKTMQTGWNSTVDIEQKVDSKAFAIPILTARL